MSSDPRSPDKDQQRDPRGRSAMAELVTGASLEMGAHRPADAADIAQFLPSGTLVYVNHLPRHTLEDTLAGAIAVRRAGLEPVPHVAARRVTSREELARFLERAHAEARVEKLLLLGGDLAKPMGPFSEAADLLRHFDLAANGIREVGFAAYPEGHPRIPRNVLDEALKTKLEIAGKQGLGPYIVTQFSFAPLRIVELCTELRRNWPEVPVYVGLPGPANPVKLLKFAQACGVSASLRALINQGFGAVQLVTNTNPEDQLAVLAQHVASGAIANVVGIHVFTFGGVKSAATWINHQVTHA